MVSVPARMARGVSARAAGAAAGVVADRVFGEPPDAVHPVARFGSAMLRLERRWWRDARGPGARYAAAGIGAAGAVGAAVALGSGARRRFAGQVVSTALAGGISTAGRSLARHARAVAADLERGDLDAARAGLPALVGRDADELDEACVVRAVIESVAENTVDAVVAPALWAVAGGAPTAFAYRAANTLDAMVGRRTPRYLRFGWASARADDVANWVPARLTAALVAAARPPLRRRRLARRAPPGARAPVAQQRRGGGGVRGGARGAVGRGEQLRRRARGAAPPRAGPDAGGRRHRARRAPQPRRQPRPGRRARRRRR